MDVRFVLIAAMAVISRVAASGAPFTVSGLQKMVGRAGMEAKMPFNPSALLRRAAGYVLATGTDTGPCKRTWVIDQSNRWFLHHLAPGRSRTCGAEPRH